MVLATLRFESGALGSIDLNFFEPAYRRGCLIVGSDAVGIWSWNDETVTVRRGNGRVPTYSVAVDLELTYSSELLDFLDATEGNAHLAPRCRMESKRYASLRP